MHARVCLSLSYRITPLFRPPNRPQDILKDISAQQRVVNAQEKLAAEWEKKAQEATDRVVNAQKAGLIGAS